MSRRCTALFLVVGMLLAASWWVAGSSSHADEKTRSAGKNETKERLPMKKALLRAFMRTKLAASQNVLEGLAVEDYNLVTTGAAGLLVVAGAAEFMVSEDPEYVEQADDFRRIVNKLGVAAKEKRLDGVTLAYVDMTMSCVECHKHVRTLPLDKSKD